MYEKLQRTEKQSMGLEERDGEVRYKMQGKGNERCVTEETGRKEVCRGGGS